MPLPTLDDFKTHLNVTTSNDDAELSDALDAAVDVVEGLVGPLRGQSVSETHHRVASDVVILRHRPIVSLESVTLRVYAGWDPIGQALTDFDLDADAGLLRLVSGYPIRGDVTVTYTAGLDTVPPAVHIATLMIGKQMWETQRGSQPLPLQAQDSGDVNFDTPSYAAGIPERARVLLEPFARGSQIA